MSGRFYNTTEFLNRLAKKSNTPILMIQTDGSNASSLRYHDIKGISQDCLSVLYNDDIVFVTFDSSEEANTAFDTLIENFPQAGETTLSITAVLGFPHSDNREFQQILGYARTFNIAA